MATTTETPVNLESLLSSVRLNPSSMAKVPMVKDHFQTVNEDVSVEDRFLGSLAAVLFNLDPENARFDKPMIQELVSVIDTLVEDQINAVMHAPEFQKLEATWTTISELVENTNFAANIEIALLDVSKEEAHEDLELNAADIAGSEFFKKVYVSEYDQLGGHPYGAVIGLYEFDSSSQDLLFLKTIGKIGAASHVPVVASASPKFFGCETMAEVNQLRDISGLFATPRYRAWHALRDSEAAAYVGLTLPRYLVRTPYNEIDNPAEGIRFNEAVRGDNEAEYVWGSAAMLFARNLVKSFETSGWCQSIRGVKAGGLVPNLPTHTFELRGETVKRTPVEVTIPDYRELELANEGFIPLVQRKGESDAVFYSTQSIKKAHSFKDPKDSENSQLVTNMAYTFSISRIAHNVKCMMRDNIGSTANEEYVRTQISTWISRYVTTIINPDDLTLRYFPFKAYSLEVVPIAGHVGWYKCDLAVLPHIQFEGMNVDLRVDARLG